MVQRIVIFGATGDTGSQLVALALKAGLVVRAFVRSPEKLSPEVRSHPNLEVVRGDLSDLKAVDKAIEGADFVVSTAGNPKASKSHLMAAFITQAVQSMRKYGVKRLVYQAGAFSPMPGQRLPFVMRVMRPIFGGLMGTEPMLADNDSVMAYLVNNASDLDWTVTRPGMIKQGPSKGVAKGATAHGSSLQFVDLAAFTLATAQASSFVREAPYVTY